jgi:hypothetical protein
LRLQKANGTTPSKEAYLAEEDIVCRGLRKVWWTKSDAPEEIVRLVSKSCPYLESLSVPRNATNIDLAKVVSFAKNLKEFWMIDCPAISEVGFRAFQGVENLQYIQLNAGLSKLQSQATIVDLTSSCQTLKKMRLLFEGSGDEDSRRGSSFSYSRYRGIQGYPTLIYVFPRVKSGRQNGIGYKGIKETH